MRKLLVASALYCLCNTVYAQNTAGKITYTETVKMNIDLGGDVDVQSDGAVNTDQIRSMLPKERSIKKVLYYNADAALYANDKTSNEEKNDNIERNDGNVRMMFKIDVPEDIIYTSLKDGKLTEQRDFMGRKFLLNSEIEKPKWKMTGNQKTILNYPCQEAVLYKEKDTVTAWFTPAIPVSLGPQGFGGLPGMILEAKQNNMITIKVDAVTAGDESKLIVKPKEGKKVTKEEFNAIVEKKQKEMQEEYGGNGNVIIKVRR